MKTRIGKWGNSLALRIPAAFAAEAKLEPGLAVDLKIAGDQMVVTPVRRRYTLEELVEGITPQNRHDSVDWGQPLGNEEW